MDKIVAVAGPTGSGKSALAVWLAEKLDGEVISCDSMQVYREMNIGTAKVTPQEMHDVSHHLINIQSYSEPWDVALFQRECRKAISEVLARGKLPILCGGTGLYLKAVLQDYTFNPEKKNPELEKELEKLTNEQLVELLRQRDPKSLEKIHPNNRRRLIRALEISWTQMNKSQREESQEHRNLYDCFLVGILTDRQELNERIEKRVDQMFEEGLVEEAMLLFSGEDTWGYTSFQGIGYREFRDYFRGEASLDEVREKIKIHTRQYARRQMTWFRNQMDVHWFSREEKETILKEIKEWYE